MGIVEQGSLASLAAGAMTAVGALPALWGQKFSARLNDFLLAFAAGVMLAASFLSLIVPGVEAARGLFGSAISAALVVVIGVGIGIAFVALLNECIPHEHFVQGRQGPRSEFLSKIWLFVLAITIHNLPEGLAVGMGFGAGNLNQGITLATGIGLQNAPEGLAVAVALLSCGYSRRFSVLVAGLTGIVEPIAGFLGAYAVSQSQLMLPWALTFAAGAMLYVISHEIIPETHHHGHANEATTGLAVGLLVMMFLDVGFG